MDVVLTIFLGLVQLVLALMGIFVSLKPPKSERHRYWIGAFAAVGFIGIGLTAWTSIRASHDQRLAREQIAIAVAAATGANDAATKANNSALKYQSELKASMQEEFKAKEELKRLINATSAKESHEIIELAAQTQASIRAISTRKHSRGIPAAERPQIIKFLSQHTSDFEIFAIANDQEAWKFAQAWRDVLTAAGWRMQGGGIGTFLSNNPPDQGMTIEFHGSTVPQGQRIQIPKASPQALIGLVARALKFRVRAQRFPNIRENLVRLEIYGYPQDK